MKIRAVMLSLLCWGGVAQAVELAQQSGNSLGVNDTSLVLLSEEIGFNDSDPQEIYAGTYYNSRNRVELQVLRSGRVSSNIVIRNGTQEYPIQFNTRLRESRYGWDSRGTYTVGFLTNIGIVYCNYPVNLLLNFYDEGATVEAELEYPTYSAISVYGQCIAGPMRVDAFELSRDELRQ